VTAPSQGDVVGIDLGTTTSCVAMMEGKLVRIIENSEGVRTTPSVVAMTTDGEILVGTPARRQQVQNQSATFFNFKRFLGRKYTDPFVQELLPKVPYKTVEGSNGDVWVEAHGKKMPMSHISGHVLAKMRLTAEENLGRKVDQAVITIPAHFTDAQRNATKEAAKQAGLNVRRFIHEPTAAALAYGLDKKEDVGNVAVFDLGGGTFDFTVLTVKSGVFEVKATGGDARLGGVDLDEALITFLLQDFERKEKIDLSEDALAVARIRELAERTKIELAHSLNTNIYVPFITADAKGPKHLQYKMSRSQHDQMMMPLLDRAWPICDAVLKEAGVGTADLDALVLVGGSTKWPKLHEVVEQRFGRAPEKDVNADEVVAAGAAVQAGVLRGVVSDVLLLDITPITIGIETEGGLMTPLIPRHTTLPAKASKVFATVADNQDTVRVRVLQGERPLAKDNRLLTVVELNDIAPAPRGQAQVEVSFEVDVSGVLSVVARDRATGKEQETVASASGLGKEDMEKLQIDAQTHASGDAALVELALTRNTLTAKIKRAEGTLREFSHVIAPRTQARTRGALDAAEAALASEDTAGMRGAMKELLKCQVIMAEDAYGEFNIAMSPSVGRSAFEKVVDAVKDKIADLSAATAAPATSAPAAPATAAAETATAQAGEAKASA
jgi:molecular chaperone DnaK